MLNFSFKRFGIAVAALVVASLFFVPVCGAFIAQDQVTMKVSMKPNKICLDAKNSLKQKAKIMWQITNHSTDAIDGKVYYLQMGEGRVGDASETVLLSQIKTKIAPGATKKGTYNKTFEAVVGAAGDHELRFMLEEKMDAKTSSIVKQATLPFRWDITLP